MGAVTRKEVDEALLKQGEDKLLELFSWTEGDVWFEADSEALPLSTPMESCKPEELILRGVQRMGPDTLRRSLLVLKGKQARLDPSGLSEGVQRDPAVERAREALEAAGGRADDLLRQHGAILFGLFVLGALRVEGDQPETKPTGLPDGPIKRAVRTGPVTHAELLETRQHQAEQSHFEVLGLAQGASAAECKSAFFALAKRYHPDRFAGEPEEIRALAGDVFARVSVAHETLSNPTQRQEYLASLKDKGKKEEENEVSQILTAEVQFQKGETLFKKKDYVRALEQFNWALDLNPEEGEYRAMRGWTTYLLNPEDAEACAQAREDLDKAIAVAPRSVTGYYYLGLLLKACAELEQAERMFRKAIELAPGHVEAARELRLFQMRREREKGSPKGSSFLGFGRKKG
jgi:curved DNA-binding protein CbpA